MGIIIDGRKISEKILSELVEKRKKIDKELKLVSITSEDESAQTYANMIGKKCKILDINFDRIFANNEERILSAIENLNKDKDVQGIIVSFPLPKGASILNVFSAIDYNKDVEALSVFSIGNIFYNKKILPSTPSAVIKILEELNFKFEGANIAIINHSIVIGKPLAIMLLNRNATVRVCHIYTKNLKENVRNSDVLIVGCGKPNLINREFVNKDMIVIDCGMNRIGNLLTGDVDFENVKDVVRAITPVPGGVGPVNVAILLRNFIELVSNR